MTKVSNLKSSSVDSQSSKKKALDKVESIALILQGIQLI